VVLDGSLARVDELLHIAGRARRVALQSALGGMAVSLLGIGFAAAGLLPPLAGAIVQEVVDLAAVTNALRASMTPQPLTDYAVRH
jgi:cation transport ATPase